MRRLQQNVEPPRKSLVQLHPLCCHSLLHTNSVEAVAAPEHHLAARLRPLTLQVSKCQAFELHLWLQASPSVDPSTAGECTHNASAM